MGTKRSIYNVARDTEENLSVPPGFVSLTSFTLKRIVSSQEDVDANAVGGEFDPGTLSKLDMEKFQSSFLHRPWFCYDLSGSVVPNYEVGQTKVDKKDPVISSLPKGVIRGCANCNDCVKVSARWHPEDPHFPVLEDAPVFYPSEEEFKDTLKYIAKLRPSAEKYGICRIVPPPSWRSPCLLEDKRTWRTSKFKTNLQSIDGLQYLNMNRITSRLRKKMPTDIPKGASTVGLQFCNGSVVDDSKEATFSETFGFEDGPEFTLKSFKKHANDFKSQYFSQNGKVIDAEISSIAVEEPSGPPVATIEGEYWRIVENPSEEIEVLSGTNLGCQDLGSGFPTKLGPTRDMAEYSKYVKSGWNLNNISKLSGSLLRYGCYNNTTILDSQLFIGMCFASQCWRTEDHHLYSLSYMHFGDPKVWYVIPGNYGLKFVEIIKKQFPQLVKHPKLLYELITQLSPSMLLSKGIPVYRCVQNPLEYVLVFPGAYHSEFSCGFNCSEAALFAPFDWLPHGQNVVELYANYSLKTSFSHDKLLVLAGMAALRAQWETSIAKTNSINNESWRNACGKDGILTKALKSRVKTEGIRRDHLCDPSRSSTFDEVGAATKRKCCICLYDLFLCAVSCSCSPNRYSCLQHSKQLCARCTWNNKQFYFRKTIADLNLLIEALEGNFKAIYRLAKRKVHLDKGNRAVGSAGGQPLKRKVQLDEGKRAVGGASGQPSKRKVQLD